MLDTSETTGRNTRKNGRTPILPHRDFQNGEDETPKLKDYQVRYQKRKAVGLCTTDGCPAKAEPAHTHCRKHLQEMSEHNKKMYAERNRDGLCIYCGERPPFWGVRCIICRQKFSRHPLPLGARRALRLYREAERRRELELSQLQARFHIRKLLASGDIKGNRAKALRLFAGLDDGRWRTYVEVAKIMDITKQYAHQLLLTPREALAHIMGNKVPWEKETGP